MNKDFNLRKYRNLIAKDKIKEAIDLVNNFLKNDPILFRDISILENQFHRENRSVRLGLGIKVDSHNRIVKGLLDIGIQIQEEFNIEEEIEDRNDELDKFLVPARKFIQEYMLESKSYHRFIDLSVKNENNEFITSIVGEVEYLIGVRNNKIALLGDFGTGKTTFLFNFLYKKAVEWLDDKFSPLPLLLRFRNFSLDQSLIEWVTKEIEEVTKINISKHEFISLLKSNRVLLMLDGLDEIPEISDRKIVNRLLNEANKISSYSSPVILTCRSTFFPDYEEIPALKRYRKLYLQELDERQIVNYIRKSSNAGKSFNTNQVVKKIETDGVLKSIAKRPLFLNFLTDEVDISSDFDVKNLGDLYYLVTQKWLVNESLKNSSIISAPQKRSLYQALAFKMFLSGEYKFTSNILREELIKYKNSNEYLHDINYRDLFQDVLNYGFFDRNNRSEIRFSHKSFAEYFLAERVCYDLIKGSSELISKKIFYEEIFEFISDIMQNLSSVNLLDNHLSGNEIPDIALINVIPPIRKLLHKNSYESIFHQFLNGQSAAIRYICGYSLSNFIETYEDLDLDQFTEQLRLAYEKEGNALVRMQYALAMNNGKYSGSKYYAELDIDFNLSKFDFDEITQNPGTIEAYRKIILYKKENPYVVEESIRMIILDNMYNNYQPNEILIRSVLDIVIASERYRFVRMGVLFLCHFSNLISRESFSQIAKSLVKKNYNESERFELINYLERKYS